VPLISAKTTQEKGGRESIEKVNTPKKSTGVNRPIPKSTPKRTFKKVTPIPPAEITISITPVQSTIFIEETNEQFYIQNGSIKFFLKPEKYNFLIRCTGYKDYRLSLNLQSGFNSSVTVTLSPLPGHLNVTPNSKCNS
jgi:hypothetical protein